MRRLSLLLLLLISVPAFAQTEYALTDLDHRATLATGVSYTMYRAGDGEAVLPPHTEELAIGFYGAYNLVPKLSLVGSVAWAFENEYLRPTLGGNYTFYNPSQGDGLSLGLGLQHEWFRAIGDTPAPRDEWALGLRAGAPVKPWLAITGSSFYGLDSHQIRSTIGLLAIIHNPKL